MEQNQVILHNFKNFRSIEESKRLHENGETVSLSVLTDWAEKLQFKIYSKPIFQGLLEAKKHLKQIKNPK